MSDELRGWLEEQRIIAESATEPEREIMMALIAKVEEFAEAFGDVPDLLREIADNARNGNAGEMERLVCTAAYLEDQAGLMDDALRAPGGGS